MPDIFLRSGQANPSDIALRDPTSLGATTGTIAATQAAQSGAIPAVERFLGPVTATQPVQTAAVVGRERDLAVLAVAQAVQSGAAVAVERFLSVVAVSQPVQTGSSAGIERIVGVVAGSQAVQSGTIAGTTVGAAVPVVEERLRHGARFDRIATRSKLPKPVLRPVLAVIGGVQPSQRSRIVARTNDDDLAYLYLELAA